MREPHSLFASPQAPAVLFAYPPAPPLRSCRNVARVLLADRTCCHPRFSVAPLRSPALRHRAAPSAQFRSPAPSTSPPNPLPPDDPAALVSTVATPAPSENPNPAEEQPAAPAPAHDTPPRRTQATTKGRPLSLDHREKISYAHLGKRKSLEVRAKISAKLKGRTPWNKGKKMSPEIRARMSESHIGSPPWNKGLRLSEQHKKAISESASKSPRALSSETRRRMRMARRRPGDSLVAGTAGRHQNHGSYSLVGSHDIHEYVSMRRELRVWSDRFFKQNERRPTLADVRRVAPVPIMRKFETYVAMRDRIRGLANDVYGTVDPEDVPTASGSDLVGKLPNDHNAKIHITKHGNRRMGQPPNEQTSDPAWYDSSDATVVGAADDMWDAYDRPSSSGEDVPESKAADHSLIGTHELTPKADHLSPNDFRKIGRHRLMETMDINRFVSLRKELKDWSATFKTQHGRTPSLSDAKSSGRPVLYSNICEFLELREKMKSLVKEVYGTEVDDVETLSKVSAEGKKALRVLREKSDHESTEGGYQTEP